MDNQSNDNKFSSTTSSELELKIRRERINKGKTENSNVKKPRRYNPVNPEFNEAEKLDNKNKPLQNNNTNNPDFPNKNVDEFQNEDENSFENKNIDSFNDEDNLEDSSKSEQNITNNNELDNSNPKETSNKSQEKPKEEKQADQVEESQEKMPTQKNNYSSKRNELNNDAQSNNLTKDPTQRKLDRINNQRKQQENLQNEANNNANQNDPKANNNTDNNSTNQNNPNASQKTPKTKGSAPTTNEETSSKASNIMNNLGKLNQMKNDIGDAMEEEHGAKDIAKNIAKEKAKTAVKKKVKEKIIAFIVNTVLPVLPYIGLALLIMLALLVIIFAVVSVFDDEDNVVDTIKINYCENVNVKWGQLEDQNVTITSNEYIKYLINTSEYNKITDKEALIPLIIVLRTNLYANSDNLDSNVCYFEVSKPYQDVSNEVLDEAMKETDNKVFSVTKSALAEIPIDDHFTYTKVKNGMYQLYQDSMSYDQVWINHYVGEENLSNVTSNVNKNSYSPFAAWYLSSINDYDALSLIFHFVTPGSYKGNIYKVVKLRSGDVDDDDYIGDCSDISLSTTSFERSEFIEKVNSSSVNEIFKKNAGKIYDISKNNNFNPEMVVIRASLEGYSPGGSTNNYWGIGCTNTGGYKACKSYSSFDEGVLGYITTVKKINSVSLFEMQKKYSYIGANWYNPGGSGVGGCYYFPYIKKYMSESRASEVEAACDPSAKCEGTACLKTTDEDQNAYTRWQIEKSLQARATIFGISADECSEEEGPTEDVEPSELGAAVAKYAVKTYDNWQYSQSNRDQNGYVDCSSLVYRAYRHFNVKVYDSSTSSGEIYRWCEKNGKTISGNSLAEGDILFYNSGSHYNSEHYKGIGHVELYIGNNQRFGAHKHYKDNPSADVSIKPYTKADLFCRPASA